MSPSWALIQDTLEALRSDLLIKTENTSKGEEQKWCQAISLKALWVLQINKDSRPHQQFSLVSTPGFYRNFWEWTKMMNLTMRNLSQAEAHAGWPRSEYFFWPDSQNNSIRGYRIKWDLLKRGGILLLPFHIALGHISISWWAPQSQHSRKFPTPKKPPDLRDLMHPNWWHTPSPRSCPSDLSKLESTARSSWSPDV